MRNRSPGRAAVQARVALALQPNALAVAGAGLDAEFYGLGPVDHALAVAGGAVIETRARSRCSGGRVC